MNSAPQSEFRVEPADYTVDFKDLRAIREPVFVLEQNVPIELEWDELDPNCHHVIARDASNTPIGTGRLTPERKIGRMAVLKQWRSAGVGKALLLALIDKARELGWREVSLHAQASAVDFYAKFGFQPTGEPFQEAGIEHQSMRIAIKLDSRSRRETSDNRLASTKPTRTSTREHVVDAVRQLILAARRDVMIYTRDLERPIYTEAKVLDACKQFAISGRSGEIRVIIHEPQAALRPAHPILALAQRLPTAFQFRAPETNEDLQYPSVYVCNDVDGFLYRHIGSRFDGDWSPSNPAQHRPLRDHFSRAWDRSHGCREFRNLGV